MEEFYMRNECDREAKGECRKVKHCAICGGEIGNAGHIVHGDCVTELTAALAASRRREKAAVADLQAFVKYPCGVCAHLQDQRFCYLNCQNHDRENHRAWQWRGPSDREVHHDA